MTTKSGTLSGAMKILATATRIRGSGGEGRDRRAPLRLRSGQTRFLLSPPLPRPPSPPLPPSFPCCVAIIVTLFVSVGTARAGVSLPLQGYYRPGRFMPVRVAGDVRLSGDSIVETTVEGGGERVAPVLVRTGARDLK